MCDRKLLVFSQSRETEETCIVCCCCRSCYLIDSLWCVLITNKCMYNIALILFLLVFISLMSFSTFSPVRIVMIYCWHIHLVVKRVGQKNVLSIFTNPTYVGINHVTGNSKQDLNSHAASIYRTARILFAQRCAMHGGCTSTAINTRSNTSHD